MENNLIVENGVTAMLKGKVKWFSEEKGYGFIEVDDKRDVFVHYAAIRKSSVDPLRIGQVVEVDTSLKSVVPGDSGSG
jgi:cold shock protein